MGQELDAELVDPDLEDARKRRRRASGPPERGPAVRFNLGVDGVGVGGVHHRTVLGQPPLPRDVGGGAVVFDHIGRKPEGAPAARLKEEKKIVDSFKLYKEIEEEFERLKELSKEASKHRKELLKKLRDMGL